MNKVDIIRKHIGNDDFYDMNGTSMLTNILNAMEEYKEQAVKNCSITDVVESACDDYVEGINMKCARCDQPKYKH